MNLLETYYTYAKLAQAAYIDLSPSQISTGSSAYNNDVIVQAGRNQKRLPENLGKQMFPDNSGSPADTWTMLLPYYHTSADTGHSDPASGYAGMLLSNPQYGKVLAIAGTEPGQPGQTVADLLNADLAQIGFLGAAFNQIVSLFNQVQEMRAPTSATNVLRLEVKIQNQAPANGTPYITQTLPDATPSYYSLEAHYDGQGQGLLAPGEKITVTGHSLGGHVAAMAVALFPDLFTTAYTFNAPGYNPPSSLLTQQQGADGLLSLFTRFGAAPRPITSISSRVITLESEDAIPGDDNEIISSNVTGQSFSPETYITTEKVTHDIGHLTEGLTGMVYNNLITDSAGNGFLRPAKKYFLAQAA